MNSTSKRQRSPLHKVELLKRIAENPDIPSPPTVVLRVLEKASAPDCSIGELCQLLQIDPGLTGKILRTVNSALFGLSRPVTSVHRALSVVGINSARLLLLSISLPEMRQTQRLDPHTKQRYWQASVAGAIVAHELSQRMRARDCEDDMAAGLLRDLGELVLKQMFAETSRAISEHSSEMIVHSQCELEEEFYGLDHAEVSAFVLDRWRLPKEMTEAIRHHHRPSEGKYSTRAAEQRAYLLHFATRSAQLFLYPDQPQLLQEMLDLAQARYGMNANEVREFLVPLTQKMADFAALLKVDLGAACDFASVLERASTELVRLSISANLENQRALELTKRAESEAQHWRHEAAYDPLTNVFNRRFLERKLGELLGRSEAPGSAIGLLFIDLDAFKPLNDRFGHLFGDLVLQQVAECLGRHVRSGDFVARYGGDEFCVVLESVDETSLGIVAQRIWESINALTVRQGANEGKVGASIGAVCYQPCDASMKPGEFLALADNAMYQAKSVGKNRVVFLEGRAVPARVATSVGRNHLIALCPAQGGN